jgi:hypothetical protein
MIVMGVGFNTVSVMEILLLGILVGVVVEDEREELEAGLLTRGKVGGVVLTGILLGVEDEE